MNARNRRDATDPSGCTYAHEIFVTAELDERVCVLALPVSAIPPNTEHADRPSHPGDPPPRDCHAKVKNHNAEVEAGSVLPHTRF